MEATLQNMAAAYVYAVDNHLNLSTVMRDQSAAVDDVLSRVTVPKPAGRKRQCKIDPTSIDVTQDDSLDLFATGVSAITTKITDPMRVGPLLQASPATHYSSGKASLLCVAEFMAAHNRYDHKPHTLCRPVASQEAYLTSYTVQGSGPGLRHPYSLRRRSAHHAAVCPTRRRATQRARGRKGGGRRHGPEGRSDTSRVILGTARSL